MYGMTIAIPDRSIVANLTNIYLKVIAHYKNRQVSTANHDN